MQVMGSGSLDFIVFNGEGFLYEVNILKFSNM